MRRLASVSLTFVALSVGCGQPAEQPPTDAEPSCAIPAGRTYAYAMNIAGAEMGFDLDGDGTIDHAFGNLPASIRDGINRDLQADFVDGSQFFLFHISDWSDPPAATDPSLAVGSVLGLDADMDPNNNFSGNGQFYAHLASFDLNCDLAVAMDQASLADGVIRASAQALTIPFLGWQTVSFQDVQMEATFDAEFKFARIMVGGTLPFCPLSSAAAAGDTPGSMLDLLVNNESVTGVYPDMDVDGDGVERLVGDGERIKECIDGDGTTTIPGPMCSCDPRIRDGYSLTVIGDAAFGRLAGAR